MISELPLKPGSTVRCFVALALFILIAAFTAIRADAQPNPSPASTVELRSPDGKIAVMVTTAGTLTFQVSLDGAAILRPSRLGLRLREGGELGRDVTVVKVDRATSNTTWRNPLGKRSEVRDHHNELKLTLREKTGGRTFEVIFRAFDDGVGFRYFLPENGSNKSFVLEEELTEFTFTTDHVCYAGDHIEMPPEDYDSRGGFAGSQEWEYRKRRLSDLPMKTVTGLPVLTETSAAWVLISEADLIDWAALWLDRAPQAPDTTAVTLRSRLAPRLDGQGLVKGTLPHASPWRFLIIGHEPGRIVESDMVLNLSSPSQIADASWVKPGMMAWDRWWPGIGKVDTATMKDFIQFASEMGWPYQLIDAGWYTDMNSPTSDITKLNPNIDLVELRRFAAEKNVRLWLWLYWTDVEKNEAYKEAFKLYKSWGIAGIKIDFMDRDDQEMVNWYEKITRAAAENQLLVNYHGAFKPTGTIRTWPNQITREGILGNEYNKWSRRVTAEHRVTLPFTRFVVGPGDYTPGGFLNRNPDQFQTRVNPTQVLGTRANQLALFVVYDSPVMCVSDHPTNLRDKPGIDFLKIVPTVWDETRVLSGAVGEHLTMARRSGADWFLGALTNSFGRANSVKLDFLGEGKWTMRWWRDARDSGANPEHIQVEDRTVTPGETIVIRMTPGGGAVAHFVRQP